VIFFIYIGSAAAQDFLTQQKKYARVRETIAEKEEMIKNHLQQHELNVRSLRILMVAYKSEKKLELYARAKDKTVYKKIADYHICRTSGKLGPKRRQGDNQIPEGLYRIDRFNPTSNFYLSLGINYPNLSDRRKSQAGNLGGDIFIHGDCVTIGCLPVTDDKIKEIYLYSVYARNSGQTDISVYIFPFQMTDATFENYRKRYSENQELIGFWENLKKGYDKFMKEQKTVRITVDGKGNYVF
jgi:murein L,D-transpeptidase YafK